MKWVAVFLAEDGPDVVGPFDREHQAMHHILSTYINENGDDPASAQVRYDQSPTEWVVALHHPWGKRPGAPDKGLVTTPLDLGDLDDNAKVAAILDRKAALGESEGGYEATDPKAEGYHDTMATIWDNRADK